MSVKKAEVFTSGTGAPDDPLSVIINGYFDDLSDELGEDIERAAEVAVTYLRRESPYRRGSGRGHYRSGWRYDVSNLDENGLGGVSARVYNRNKPTLTHLLENGHDLKRKKGGPVIGHAPPIPHIDRGRKAALEYLMRKGW